MTTLIRVIETALPVLAALILGMFCREKKFLSRDAIDALKKVAVNLTLPFVLLNAFATADYRGNALVQPLLIFVLCVVALGIGWVLAKLLKLPGKLPPYLASGFEAGMLGYALFVLLFPGDSTASFAILDLGQVLFVFTLYKGLLSGKDGLKAVVKDILVSPIIWAIAAGVIIGATGLYRAMGTWGVAGILDSLTSFLSAPTGVIILLVNRTILNGMIHEGAAILLMILPPPYVLPIFADDPNQRTAISSALSALTLVSLIIFAVMTALV